MTASVAWLGALLILADCPVEVRLAQVAPVLRQASELERPAQRAVVLIQGLRPHFFSERNAARAQWQSWQRPDSRFVQALDGHADVFAIAYSQNAAVDRIARTFACRGAVQRLKSMGYTEIVLVGHSAGGLIARQLVEDHPDAGATKVIQICSPNAGATLARAEWSVREPQEVFLESLGKRQRQAFLAARADRSVPAEVDFVCLVGLFHLELDADFVVNLGGGNARFSANIDKRGDGLVSAASQWPADLQAQGVPAVALPRDHFRIVQGRQGTATLVRLVTQPQPRWNEGQVARAREEILGTR